MKQARGGWWFRPAGRFGAAAVCLLVFACSSGPPSADVLFGGSAVAGGASDAVSAGGFDGLYTGTADILVNGNFGCPLQLAVSNFRVQGGEVRFGGFRAPIAADGSVANAWFAGMTLNGHFAGTTFTGAVNTQAGYGHSGPLQTCLYTIKVQRTAG